MGFYLVQPCKSTAAYEAVPHEQHSVKLDLKVIEQKLAELDFEILANAKILLVVRRGECEISIYPSGKLLLKIDDKTVAEQMADELEQIIFSTGK